jgi:hypothetical protein
MTFWHMYTLCNVLIGLKVSVSSNIYHFFIMQSVLLLSNSNLVPTDQPSPVLPSSWLFLWVEVKGGFYVKTYIWLTFEKNWAYVLRLDRRQWCRKTGSSALGAHVLTYARSIAVLIPSQGSLRGLRTGRSTSGTTDIYLGWVYVYFGNSLLRGGKSHDL